MTTELTKAAQQALEALEEIALAGMSGTGQESEEGMRDWHARQAWKFIGIAARALDPLKSALTQRPAAQAERDILNDSAWIAGAKFGWNCGVEGTRDLLNQCIEQRIKDRVEARASLPAPQQATPATPEDIKVYDGIAAGYFADTQQAAPGWSYAQVRVVDENTVDIGRVVAFADEQATPEPVGEPVAYREKLTGRLCEPDDTHRLKFQMCYEPLFTRPAPGVPEADPLQGAVDWFWQAIPNLKAHDVANRLSIGCNRAARLLAAAQAKGGQA